MGFKTLFFIILLFTSSCRWFSAAEMPFFMGGYVTPPQGTPIFVQGWKEGCNSSSYTRGNVFYKTIHHIQYDPKLIDNPEYRFGYARGYTTCFQIVVSGNSGPQASFDTFILPQGAGTFDYMKAGDINGTWGMFSSGIFQGDVTNSNFVENGFDGIVKVVGSGVINGNPLWAGGSAGQFFGQ